MVLKDLPKEELPREKAIRYGIETLSNAELLAILLRTGTQELSVIELAYKILSSFDGIKGLANTNYTELSQIKGLKSAKALSLLAMIEFSKRINYQISDSPMINSVQNVFELWEPKLRNEQQEKCIIILLNSRHCLIKAVELFKGGLTRADIHPRDIFREAVKANAASLILVHNHPSGDPTPSKADIEITISIAKLGRELGITVLDHIIIGQGKFFSLKSSNLF